MGRRGGLLPQDIKSHLAKCGSERDAATLFALAVEKGIVARVRGQYAIPIPSMRDWLIGTYAPDRELPRRGSGEMWRKGPSLKRNADSVLEL